LKNKSAFTMIELVFVIVVLGILASLAMGRMDRDLRQEAAESILSHIRLTQQLALRDNKHRSDNDARWQKTYWRFQFTNCSFGGDVKPVYSVGSSNINSATGKLSKRDTAIDPINGKYMYATCNSSMIGNDVSESIFIGKHFGVKKLEMKKCTAPQYIGQNFGFDYMGRLHVGISGYNGTDNFSKLATKDCELRVTMGTDINNDGVVDSDDNFKIIIEPKTGHAYIFDQNQS
jgi:prepilin-type N-terminal cleavage/methylation domain-containing protein